MRKLILIDGNSLLHRAYHAYPPLTTPKGELINAAYGFTAMLLSVLEKLSPTHVAVAWDVKGPTFRKLAYAEYKANRGPMDEELSSQIDRTKEIVGALNIPQFGLEGFEGDDIIGTLSVTSTNDKDENDVQVIIVTGDRDSLQLIKEKRVVVYLPIQNHHSASTVFDEDRVKEVYGMNPKQLIDLKSLMGDSSDNIPGVRGIGKVTATKLIQKYGTTDNLYKEIEDVSPPRIKGLLKEGEEMARSSYDLAKIKTDVPLSFDWESCLLTNYDKGKVISLFNELNFKSLITKLPPDNWEREAEDIFL